MTEAQIRELVGELIVAGFEGTEVTDDARRLVVNHHVKNIILFKRNVVAADQLAALNQSLQDIARESGHKSPLFICTDQENGIVRRVSPGVPGLPGNMAIGATGNAKHAYAVGRLTAKQLLAMGVNMNLAPVMDVNNNPENPVIGVRSYGEDANRVALFGAEMIRGLQEHGVAACAKHFPGHGDTSVDSHLALPEIAHSMDRLKEVELKPFMKAMEVGVDVIMTAHIVFSSIESEKIPATISKAVLTDFLRKELGYEGVITTDCLEMNAISESVGVAEGAVQALLAGANLLMISHRLDRQEAAINAVVQAVLDGRVPEQRLVEAATRVQNLRKKRLGTDFPVLAYSKGSGQGALESSGAQHDSTWAMRNFAWNALMDESKALQNELCAAAVTVVSNTAGLIPLNAKTFTNRQRVNLLVDSTVTRMVASDNSSSYQFAVDALYDVLPRCDIYIHHLSDSIDSSLAGELAGSSLIVAGISGAKNQAYLDLVSTLAAAGLPVIVLALQSPYDLRAVSDVPTQLAIYEYTPWMVRAGIDALFGKGGNGQLPVSL